MANPSCSEPAASCRVQKLTCLCSPTNHPGSFRCSRHRTPRARPLPSSSSFARTSQKQAAMPGMKSSGGGGVAGSRTTGKGRPVLRAHLQRLLASPPPSPGGRCYGMKRQRPSYANDDNPNNSDNRRRFYDRGGPPPPPSRRHAAEYESGDGFETHRRKGFGGRFYDHRYREPSSSPRGYGGCGGERAMHRSESFSGFRREGYRAERDRPRWDGADSSAWRRASGGGWRDPHGLDGHGSAARRQASSPPTSSRRSPSELGGGWMVPRGRG